MVKKQNETKYKCRDGGLDEMKIKILIEVILTWGILGRPFRPNFQFMCPWVLLNKSRLGVRYVVLLCTSEYMSLERCIVLSCIVLYRIVLSCKYCALLCYAALHRAALRYATLC